MQTLLTVLHLFLAIGLIGLILIQHGKGADMGAAFGSGASATVFGARGAGNFLSRSTAVLATLFFLTSIALAYYAAQVGEPPSLMDQLDQTPVAATPKTEAPAAASVPAPEVKVDQSPAQAEIPVPAPVPPELEKALDKNSKAQTAGEKAPVPMEESQ